MNADSLFVAGDYLTASNMYAYCNGNPVMFVDPSGMESEQQLFWRKFGEVLAIFADILQVGMVIYQEDHGSNYKDGQRAIATIMYNMYHDTTHNDYKNWKTWGRVLKDFNGISLRHFAEAVLEIEKFLNAINLASQLVYPEAFGNFTPYAFPGGGFYSQNRSAKWEGNFYDNYSDGYYRYNGDVLRVYEYVQVGDNVFIIRWEDR